MILKTKEDKPLTSPPLDLCVGCSVAGADPTGTDLWDVAGVGALSAVCFTRSFTVTRMLSASRVEERKRTDSVKLTFRRIVCDIMLFSALVSHTVVLCVAVLFILNYKLCCDYVKHVQDTKHNCSD